MIELKSLKTLEYNKILEKLSFYASSQPAKIEILNSLPTNNINEVKILLQETQESYKVLYEHCAIINFSIDDIVEIVEKAEKGAILSIVEIKMIAKLLKVGRLSLISLQEINDNSIVLLPQIYQNIYTNASLEEKISSSFESDNEVSDNASFALKTIRNQIRACNEKIKTKLISYTTSPKYSAYLQNSLITIRNNRYVLPVKAEYRSQIDGLIHDQSSSGSTIFIEPIAIVNLNNELKSLLLDESKEIESILKTFTFEIGNECVGIMQTYQSIITLDKIFARASYARAIKGICPNINSSGKIDIKNGRHPLIDKNQVVPVSIHIGQDYTTMVITGPNTGGKTVLLKLVGLLCLMTMSGMFIPADDESEIAIFSNIFCDIGDNQSIENNLSTFSSHMVNLINITNNVNTNCLALFDELGAGTDPSEGSAIAISIIDYLSKKNCITITTSHYNELKEYSYTTDGVCNASMDFNPQTFMPTYKLLIGMSGNSNALEIAKNLGLNERIVSFAKSQLSQEKIAFDKVIASAENARRDAESFREKTALEYSNAKEYAIEIKNKLNQVSLKEQKLDDKLSKNAKELLSDYIDEAEELIDKLKDTIKQGDEKALFEARNIRKKLQGKYVESEYKEEIEKLDGNIKVGDNVYVSTLNATGEVCQINAKKKEYIVRIGIMTSSIKFENCQKVKKHEKHVIPKAFAVKQSRQLNTIACPLELNLLGQTKDEALFNLDQYLAEAYGQHYKEVRIVHGKGTGVLRSAVRQYLKECPYVSDFRLGKYGEGEIGVTIVTFGE